ncbi:MAG: hypothetical protein J7621_18810 [Niastella sp.]|nr:hypothetical protein [Niastella sp.]
MKKVFMLATMIVAITGMTMAQTSPKPAAKQPAKKEATAPAPAKEEVAKSTKDGKKGSGHHHKKHTKAAKQS